MKNEKEITAMLDYHVDNLRGWAEPDGYLIPTEPDEEEREKVRLKLKGAIFALEWVLE